MYASSSLSRPALRRLIISNLSRNPSRPSLANNIAVRHLSLRATATTIGRSTSGFLDRHNSFQQLHHQHQQQQKRSIFIQSEETPNPESIKFIPSGVPVLEDTKDGEENTNGYFVNKTDPQDVILRSPLAKDLFEIDGIKSVYLGKDFVTVTKRVDKEWRVLNPFILNCLMTFFDKGIPALNDQPVITDTTILDDDDEVVAMIKELIETRIRPAVQEDGGDIRYVGFEEETGIVTVELAGSCVGCPSSSVTLKQGVENMLMHYIPEVTAVVALEEEPPEGEVVVETTKQKEEATKQKTYEERLKAAGIPFSD